jgi:HSP20 family protein
MTLINWQKEAPVRQRSAYPQMNDFFTDIFGEMLNSDIRKWNVPAVNIAESEKEFKLLMAAPGLNKEDIKITIEENRLTISAEQKKEASVEKEKYSRKEFSFTNFSRSFMLPENVNIDAVKADYENGIMTVLIPKVEESKPKTKEIKIS